MRLSLHLPEPRNERTRWRDIEVFARLDTARRSRACKPPGSDRAVAGSEALGISLNVAEDSGRDISIAGSGWGERRGGGRCEVRGEEDGVGDGGRGGGSDGCGDGGCGGDRSGDEGCGEDGAGHDGCGGHEDDGDGEDEDGDAHGVEDGGGDDKRSELDRKRGEQNHKHAGLRLVGLDRGGV